MLKAYSYRLYPNASQEQLLRKHFGCVRFVYNEMLGRKKRAYEADKTNISAYELINQLPELKKEYDWLSEVNAQSLQMSVRNLDSAYTKFFKEKK